MGIDIVLLFFYFSFALINTGDAFCLSHSRSTTPSSQMEMGRKSRSSDGVIARSTKNPSSDESFEETQPSRSRRKKLKQKTFTRFVEIESWRSPEMQEMAPLLLGLGNGCKLISDLIKRSSSDGNLGLFGEMNIQGEDQKKLDVVSNTILKTMLCSTGILFGVASEEEDYVQACEDVCDNLAFSEGQFGVVFDPLDGSSNVDAGLPVGTIFGVYRKQSVDQSGQEALMQRGRQTVAAGYCLYGAATILVISTGNGVNGFTLDTKKGQFILTYPDMRIPQRGNTYYFNEANSLTWSPGIQSWIRTIKQGLGETGEQYRQIYMGALVADLHQLMLAGGVFGYPADARNPRGKLRLLYEGNPISYLIEQAGGVSVVGSSSGPQRVLDIEPLELHQREPLIFGSREDIYELYTHLEKED